MQYTYELKIINFKLILEFCYHYLFDLTVYIGLDIYDDHLKI